MHTTCSLQVCRELYEVMTQLAEQHSDKVFTIQGAPRSVQAHHSDDKPVATCDLHNFLSSLRSDSGPLRLARTPSPPEDDSPPESPDAAPNHMLRPVSPGPPRPKSPVQVEFIVSRTLVLMSQQEAKEEPENRWRGQWRLFCYRQSKRWCLMF